MKKMKKEEVMLGLKSVSKTVGRLLLDIRSSIYIFMCYMYVGGKH